MKYFVNNTWIAYEPEGECHYGAAETLIEKAIDLTSGKPWSNIGFTIEKLFTGPDYITFKNETHTLLLELWRQAGLHVPKNFRLDQYHTVAKDRATHLAAVEKTKLLSTAKFPGGISKIEKRISEICGTALQAFNPYDDQSVFHFRVVRPQSVDNNPLHRDVWLEDYDNCINLYIPIAGSNEFSSLILLPGSHRWPESRIQRTVQGALINGIKFNVPAVTSIDGEYTIERPDPKENEVLVFSPYLIHGGAVNLNSDQTRISIELRLWKKV